MPLQTQGKQKRKGAGAMEFYQLKTFKAVADEGNLTRAAGRLGASQPSVSAHIKSLEEEMGIRLFVRSRKGMQLTGEGQKLLARAETVLSSVDEMLGEAQKMQSELSGALRIGLNANPSFLKTTEFFSAMRACHPALELQLINSASQYILKYIKQGEFDGGYVLGENRYSEIETVFLETVTLSILAPSAWGEKLAGKTLSELSGMPWILSAPGCSFREATDELFEVHGIVPARTVLADDCATCAPLLAAEAGLGVMETERAKELAERGEAILLAGVAKKIDLSFAFLAKRREDPVISAMREAIRDIWALPAANTKGD